MACMLEIRQGCKTNVLKWYCDPTFRYKINRKKKKKNRVIITGSGMISRKPVK